MANHSISHVKNTITSQNHLVQKSVHQVSITTLKSIKHSSKVVYRQKFFKLDLKVEYQVLDKTINLFQSPKCNPLHWTTSSPLIPQDQRILAIIYKNHETIINIDAQ